MLGWLRAGAADWTVAKHLNVAASAIISNILLPNLVWKVSCTAYELFKLLIQ